LECAPRETFPLNKYVHFGRLDKSKRISEIVDTIREERTLDPKCSLTLYGSPSTPESFIYINRILQESQASSDGNWLILHPAVPRNSISSLLLDFDVFIHAYLGSLDKTILEATFVGIPVVTANPEYLAIFGSWNPTGFISLQNEIEVLRTLRHSEVVSVLNSRYTLAQKKHSLANWSYQVAQILNR
jgi:glycosyltransferase involved in cell wall biosynthesis